MLNYSTPPVAFNFKVEFINIGNADDMQFVSVNGLGVSFEFGANMPLNNNVSNHQLTGKTHSDLVLIRGILKESDLTKWFLNGIDTNHFKPAEIHIQLLDNARLPLITWIVYDAYPKKWSVSEFHAMESKVVLETFELTYKKFIMK